MPTNLKVIHPTDFLRARPDGAVDLETSERMLQELATAAEGLDQFQVLIDVRNVSGRLSPADLYQLASSLLRYRQAFSNKTALLCPRERFDHARLFSLLAASHGFQRIRAFLVYEDAMEWLMAEEP